MYLTACHQARRQWNRVVRLGLMQDRVRLLAGRDPYDVSEKRVRVQLLS
jgi:hypothetical protein